MDNLHIDHTNSAKDKIATSANIIAAMIQTLYHSIATTLIRNPYVFGCLRRDTRPPLEGLAKKGLLGHFP